MKKNILMVIVLFLLVQTIKAQAYSDRPLKFGIGAVAGLPMSDAKSFYNLAYGLDVLGEYRVSPAFAFTADGCFGAFTKKSTEIHNQKLIYGLAGIKYFTADIVYFQLQAGISIMQSTGTSTTFIAAPSIGVNITPDIDLSVKYQAQIEKGYNYPYIGLRLGVKFLSINL